MSTPALLPLRSRFPQSSTALRLPKTLRFLLHTIYYAVVHLITRQPRHRRYPLILLISLLILSVLSSLFLLITIPNFQTSLLRFRLLLQYINPFNSGDTHPRPPFHYDLDPNGAVDIYRHGSITLCRIYRVCATNGGIAMLLPSWMSNYSQVLSGQCGISLGSVKFANVEDMGIGLSFPAKFDWLAQGVPAPVLKEFFTKRLTLFYRPMAKRGKSDISGGGGRLIRGWYFERECLEPNSLIGISGKHGEVSRICGFAPEGSIARPSVLVNLPGEVQRANGDFERFLQKEFKDSQGSSLKILDAEMLFVWQDKLCFRSVIVSPGEDRKTGQTVMSELVDDKKGRKDRNEDNVSDAEGDSQLAADAFSDLRRSPSSGDRAQALLREGGVEIVTHNEVAEQSAGDGPAVCRIYRTCRRSDGTLVIPDWLKEHDEELQVRCGLSANTVAYIDANTFDMAYELDRDRKLGVNDSEGDPGGPLSLDLFGARTVRPQPQHFMVDFLPHLHSLDAILQRTNKAIFERSCIYRPGSTAGPRTAVARNCLPDGGTMHSLRPAIVVPDKLRSSGPAFRFTRQFQSLLPPPKIGPRYLYAGKLHEDPDEAVCFRSVTVVHPKLPLRTAMKGSNALYASNGLSYDDIRDRFINDGGGSSEGCKVVVKILQARMARGNYNAEDGRTFIWPVVIGNSHELASAISAQAHESLISRQVQGFSISVEHLHYDGTSVPQLLHHLQETDVLIAPHDPSLTSLVFLRPGTTVIEIPPFAYYAGPYKSLAENLNLDYIRMPSKPDLLSFKTCLRARGDLDWPDGTAKNTKRAAVERVIELFESAAREFGNSGYSESLRLERSRGEARAQVPQERICARGQRLMVETERVAAIVVERAGRRCRTSTGRIRERNDDRIQVEEM